MHTNTSAGTKDAHKYGRATSPALCKEKMGQVEKSIRMARANMSVPGGELPECAPSHALLVHVRGEDEHPPSHVKHFVAVERQLKRQPASETVSIAATAARRRRHIHGACRVRLCETGEALERPDVRVYLNNPFPRPFPLTLASLRASTILAAIGLACALCTSWWNSSKKTVTGLERSALVPHACLAAVSLFLNTL